MRSGAEHSLPVGRVTALGPGDVASPGRFALEPGPLGVIVVVSGLPLGDLARGTRLRVGGALLELGGEVLPTGLADAADPAGPFAACVVEAGAVEPGDAAWVEAVTVPVEDALDLHPFAPSEIALVVAEYLERAQAAGLGEVRLIHGRGRGVQREIVRRVLAASPLVVSFADAPAERGGWGAMVAHLRPAR